MEHVPSQLNSLPNPITYSHKIYPNVTHFLLGTPHDYYLRGVPTKILHLFLVPLISVTCPAHHNFFDFTNLLIMSKYFPEHFVSKHL